MTGLRFDDTGRCPVGAACTSCGATATGARSITACPSGPDTCGAPAGAPCESWCASRPAEPEPGPLAVALVHTPYGTICLTLCWGCSAPGGCRGSPPTPRCDWSSSTASTPRPAGERGPSPLDHEPRSVRPPFTERDDGFDHLRGSDPEAWRRAVQLDRLSALLEPLAGVELSEREHAILEWLSGWDVPTVAPVVSLLHRARAAGPLGHDPTGSDRTT